MIQHPTIAAALAEQRRAAFMAEAETARQAREARAARNGGDRFLPAPALCAPRKLFHIPTTHSRWPATAPALKPATLGAGNPLIQVGFSQLISHIRNIETSHTGAENVEIWSGTHRRPAAKGATVRPRSDHVISVAFLAGPPANPASTKRKTTLV